MHLTGMARFSALALAILVGGCIATPPPPPKVELPEPAAQPPAPSPRSAESQALADYYAKVQADLLSQGLLRTDGGGRDAPFTDTMLAENFIRVALFDEYKRSPTGLVAQQTQSHLRRWEQPVRVQVTFGPSVPPDTRETDRARIKSYLARLATATGHPISVVDSDPNFWIEVVSEDERRAMGPVISARMPSLSPAEVAGLVNLPRSTYCVVYALSNAGSYSYSRAIAVIRAEHPDLLRLSCLHEELAQGLGLANDSPLARPSIFNDDEEFALLTRQDELMLRMLYDPALKAGMTATDARPVVHQLATDLIGGES